ncbi:MAG: T9SS type A sorting domain-containing protein [Prevotella sp.]
MYVDGCPSTAVEVYDANGKRVSSTARSVVSGLPHGLYIVKAGKLQKKIVL